MTHSALLDEPMHGATHEDVGASTTTARPLRVAHVSLTLKTGGLERLLVDFARHHDRTRVQLEFIAISEVGWIADELRAQGCPVHQLQPGGRWSRIRQLRKLFRDQQIDVVHTHNTYPHLWGSVAAKWAGVPVVVQTRHGQRSGHGWKSSWQYRQAARLVDRVIAVSDDAASLTVQQDGVPSSKVQRIWNGIDLDHFAYHGPVARPIAISVARLSAEKDFATLLQATALAARNIPDFQLWIVGDGPERSRLEQLAQDFSLQQVVTFLGERQDVPDLLKQAAFFVTATRTEGISLTLLEAMAAGLPVIATAVGGNPEIIVPGETGQLVPAGSAEQLAAAIEQLVSQPALWKPWGQAGRARVATHFEARRMVQEYTDLYDELTAPKRRVK